jgi:RNA polymerase-binding transcription factor DksA
MADVAEAGPRAALTAERKRVSNELEAIGIDSGANDSGFADSGQVTAERGEVDALVGSLQDTLNDVDDALAKIDAGTYGVCEQCGKPIGEARLEAMPAARLCITCASARR